MKKQFIILVIAVGKLLIAQVPDTLTLEYCQYKARASYPLHQQFELLQSAAELKNLNLTTNWYPQLAINGQSTYQSDVTTLPLHVPGITIPEIDNDIYNNSFAGISFWEAELATVVWNTIFQNGDGIYLMMVPNATLWQNQVENNTGVGINIGYSHHCNIFLNSFHRNSVHLFFSNQFLHLSNIL